MQEPLDIALIEGLAREHGTPLYVYDGERIARQLASLERFDVVRFAQKACSNIHILRLLREAGFKNVRRYHSNRRRLYGNRPRDIAAHLVEPLAFRALASFRTQLWMRALAG